MEPIHGAVGFRWEGRTTSATGSPRRVTSTGRHIQLRGSSYRTRHHQKREKWPDHILITPAAIISGKPAP